MEKKNWGPKRSDFGPLSLSFPLILEQKWKCKSGKILFYIIPQNSLLVCCWVSLVSSLCSQSPNFVPYEHQRVQTLLSVRVTPLTNQRPRSLSIDQSEAWDVRCDSGKVGMSGGSCLQAAVALLVLWRTVTRVWARSAGSGRALEAR